MSLCRSEGRGSIPLLGAMFKLKAGDVLISVNEDSDPISVLSRWAIGKYEHAAMYIGTASNIPLLYDSTGRGVLIKSLYILTGEKYVVLRPQLSEKRIANVLNTALFIASQFKSFYDYFAIVHSCIPRVMWEKFPFLPIPPSYVRDDMMICSEAVAEPFWRNNIEILPRDIIPLPPDFLDSDILSYQYCGKIMEDIFPDTKELVS